MAQLPPAYQQLLRNATLRAVVDRTPTQRRSAGHAVRRGRRPGPTLTPEAVLTAARRCFAELGYDGATVRRIAREARVDPSLVVQLFGSKEHLFRAALEVAVDPADAAFVELRRGSGSIGARALRAYLTLWETPGVSETLSAMLVSSGIHPEASDALRRFFWGWVAQPIFGEIRPDGRGLRFTLAASHMLGIALARYVLKIPPLAGTELERLIQLVAPTLDRYLTGDLDLSDSGDAAYETWGDFPE